MADVVSNQDNVQNPNVTTIKQSPPYYSNLGYAHIRMKFYQSTIYVRLSTIIVKPVLMLHGELLRPHFPLRKSTSRKFGRQPMAAPYPLHIFGKGCQSCPTTRCVHPKIFHMLTVMGR